MFNTLLATNSWAKQLFFKHLKATLFQLVDLPKLH